MSGMNWLAQQFTFKEFQVIEKAIINYMDVCKALNVEPSIESFVQSMGQATTQRRQYEFEQILMED